MFDKIYYIASIMNKHGNSKTDEDQLRRLGAQVMFVFDPVIHERAVLKYMNESQKYILTSTIMACESNDNLSYVKITTENSIYILREKKVQE